MVITYLRIDGRISKSDFDKLRGQIPYHYGSRIDGFRRFNDRLRYLFGLLILGKTWQSCFDQNLDLEQIKRSELNRPYLPGHPADFNISHSGDYVVCVLSANYRVGIDVEKVREVNLNDFKRTMNQQQWAEIHQSQEPLHRFFSYWTMKESVIKADGRGLAIPLTEIAFNNNTALYDNEIWYLHPYSLDTVHTGCLASNREITKVELVEVDWRKFL